MRVLDLFAGLGGWSGPFRERGHDVVTLDLDPRFGSTITADVLEVTSSTIVDALGGRPDIVLASPPCEAFSVLQIGRHWTKPPHNEPKTDHARLARRIVERTRELIAELEPAFFIIENPRAKLRRLPVVADLERRTVTYCQYGEAFMKPTDLWGGFPPSFVTRPICKAGASCHVGAPRGSTTGIQGVGVIEAGSEPNRLVVDGVEVSRRTAYKRIARKVYGAETAKPFELEVQEPGHNGGPPARTPASLLSAHSARSIGLLGTWDKGALAALRAKIPDELALDVCLAAERDLVEGPRAPAGRLF